MTVITIRPETGTRLIDLQAQYPLLKAEADEAGVRLKACTDAIKTELAEQITKYPQQTEIGVEAGDGRPGLRMQWRTAWRLDSKRLKAEQLETWVRYASQSGSWVLTAIKPEAGAS